jgi:hypothetical protein
MNPALWITRTGNKHYMNFERVRKDTNAEFTGKMIEQGLLGMRIREVKTEQDARYSALFVMAGTSWYSFIFDSEQREVWFSRRRTKWVMLIGYRDLETTPPLLNKDVEQGQDEPQSHRA